MMYWITNWSVKFRRIVIAIGVGFLIFGFAQFGNMNRDILPEFSPTTVEVQTEALGLSAAEVEQLITVPLEQDLLNGVAFLDSIESASLPGLSSVVMTFESGTELLDARQVVTERLTQAAGLPQVADTPQMIQPLSSTSRVSMVSLNSDELTPIEISVLAKWVMVPRLLGVEGVANVAIWGFRDQQLQVLVDPTELAIDNVTLSQVVSTAGNALEVSPLSFLEASLPGTGGFIDTVNQRLHVFHEQAITTPDELAAVTVEGIDGGAVFVGGQPLELGDVAEIVTDHQPLIGDARCAGGPCILLVIEKFPDANTPAVTEGVDEALAALSLGLPGMEIDSSVYRPAAFIDAAGDNLRGALIISGILLVLALAALLYNWRVALVAIGSIAGALLAAGVVLFALGATVNTMIFAGVVMALVVIIDDAIISAWDTSEATKGGETGRVTGIPAVVDSILRTRSVALYAAIIVAAAMLPVAVMAGEAGAFLEPIALAYLLAIGAALVVSVTLAPALSVVLLSEQPDVRDSAVMIRIRGWFSGIVGRMLPRAGVAAGITVALVVVGAVALVSLNPSLRPALKERDILIELDAAPGTSLTRMDQITAAMVDDLRGQAGVTGVGAHVGRAIMSDQIVNVNSGEIWLNIGAGADYDATIDRIESVVAGYSEVAGSVSTYSDRRVTEILDEPTEEVVVRVYGENPEIRQTMSEQVREVVAGVAGVENARITVGAEEPTIEIEVDLDRALAFGVKPGDVRRQATTLVSGLVVGNLFEDQKVFDVVVWGVPAIRDTAEDVQALPITTPSGDQVPLGDIADVRIVPNPTVIRHEGSATFVDIKAGVTGRSVSDVTADVDEAVAAVEFPLEHHAEVLGTFAEVQAAQTRVITATVAAVLLIYLLLQASFASWRLASLAFLVLPAGVSGAALAVVLTGGDLTLGATAGMVAVLALATRGVIMLVRSYQHRERQGVAFGEELIATETGRLLTPIIISAVAVTLAYLPLAIVGSRAGLEIAGPMAVAVLGGLITSVVLLVVVVPTVFLRWGYVANPDREAEDLFATHPAVATNVGA